ncbi:Cytochrome P450 4g15 [Cryptotermes secundus]|uniref:Cytochrome P450 4g15 n=1 Tax=Cryptotermes secundus TaxID=105785 RepID=A0A2J7RLH7_9NEOP|nr:cytochrome P450 4g15 [Cryptotermes secundus]PNF41696.1 Cytochrome P450 4g15 [Cryptotermes secundus]
MTAATEVVDDAATSATNTFYYLLIPALVLGFVYWKLQRRRFVDLANKLPGPRGYPIIGNAMDFLGNSLETTERFIQFSFNYGNIMRFWIFHKLVVFIADPRDVELILGNSTHLDKSEEYRFFKPWLGEGLLISSGQKWKSHRKLIAPTFHLNVLKSFVELFNANSRAVCEKMAKENGKTFDCHDYMSECTVEILLETAMGVSKKTQDRSGYEYAMAVMKMCNILHLRQAKIWLRPDWLFKITKYGKEQIDLLDVIHGLTKKVIKRKKEEISSGNKKYIESSINPEEKSVTTAFKSLKDDLDEQDENDVGQKKRLAFLDLMIETSQNGVVLTDEEIKEEVDTIMFEGHDTTAAGSSFFLCLMGLHQKYQDMCVQELNQIFGDSDRPATFADTLEMKFLERCLLEALRMYPPVPIIARKLQEDVKLASSGHIVPKGTTIVVATVKTHRLETYWENPDVYNPDNHLPEKAAERHFYSFIPFSAGPRSCVGRKYALLKLKIILSTILRNFKVYSDIPEDDYRLQADIILKRADGFKIRLEPRRKNIMAS